MIQVKNIYLECEADTLLVELILQRGRAGHRNGISEVQNALKKIDTNDIVIGVIDTDKFKKPERYKFIQEFKEIENKVIVEGLLILNKPNTNKYLIRIHPGFEKWIWDLAIKCKIKCPFDSIELLKYATKSQKVSENKELKKFINDIVSLNPAPIRTLRDWLSKA